MKVSQCLVLFSALVSLNAFAQESASFEIRQRLGVEAGVLALSQSGGGDTTTVLPLINFKLWTQENFTVVAQAGGTAYKEASMDKTFGIGVLRINPLYRFADTAFSVEGLLGVQAWEGRGTKADLGLRVNYNVRAWTNEYLDEAFAGGGTINHDNVTNYFTVGFKKQF